MSFIENGRGDVLVVPAARAAATPAVISFDCGPRGVPVPFIASCFMAAMWAKIGRNVHSTSSCISANISRRPRGRSSNPKSIMRHIPTSASTSSLARCVTRSAPKASAIRESLWEDSRGSAMRERESVSIHVLETSCPPGTLSIKVRSKVALCARTGRPPTKSASALTVSLARGAPVTSSSVMCVSATISGGIGFRGSTNVSKRSTTSLPEIFAADISIKPHVLKERPVVSVSRTTMSSSRRSNSVVLARSASVRYDARMFSGVSGRRRS